MNRRTVFLLIALALSIVFASWQWFRPYAWGADAKARYRIEYANVKGDHDYSWLDLQLKREGKESHDLTKPVLLLTADGRELPPAETVLGGDETTGITQLNLRFWLENTRDLAGPLKLKLNDGTLDVRDGNGAPVATGSNHAFYTSHW